MQYCSLEHWTLLLSPVTSTNGYCYCFGSITSFFSGVISPLIYWSILGTNEHGEFLFQYPIILTFHTVHGVLKARILKWFALPFSSEPHSGHQQMVNTEITLTMFFEAKDGEALYSQQKQDRELTVAQIMNSLLQIHIKLKKLGKTTRPFSSVQFRDSVFSHSLRPHELQHARPPCPSPTPGVHSNSRPSSL